MEKVFPKYIGLPLQISIFEVDDALMIMIGVFFFNIIKWWWLGLIVGFIIPFFYIRVKKNKPRGFFNHTLYFLGFISLKCKKKGTNKEIDYFPNPMANTFME